MLWSRFTPATTDSAKVLNSKENLNIYLLDKHNAKGIPSGIPFAKSFGGRNMSIVHSQCIVCKSELRIDAWFETQYNSQASLLRLVSSYTSRMEPIFKTFSLCFTCGTSIRTMLTDLIEHTPLEHFTGNGIGRVWTWLSDTIDQATQEEKASMPADSRSDCDACYSTGWVGSGITDWNHADFGRAYPCPECQPKMKGGLNHNDVRSNDATATATEWSHLSRPNDTIDLEGVHKDE